ncbi:MAG: recombinase family protein [Firmicutes bacterium]|nr:recombinase family protein [Bacillota bacterium]
MKITEIPALSKLPVNVMSTAALLRVAGYARVSTNEEEQLNSYAAQVEYYTKYIQAKPEWEFVGVYTDEGISATSTKKRDGFNSMIADALAGKIDLIITKSVSRFARNTVDTLTTVRKLKEKGIGVFFEKENIHTLDSKGELLITIMSSLAQEESRSISENVTWGMRKRFSDGKVSLPYKRFLGYEKGPDGLPVIVPEEAEIVRVIYRLFLYGKAPSFIASLLTDEGVPTPGGKAVWRHNVIISMLQNEKYAGNALLQKKYTTDFLTKRQKVNEGEVPQWYVENSHPAIIEQEMFDLVQYEFQRRAASGQNSMSAHPFSCKIFCGECGAMYGSKVWHSNDPRRRRTVWQCNDKYKSDEICRAPHVTEEQIEAAFLEAFNRRVTEQAEIREGYDAVLALLADTSALDIEADALTQECEVVMELARKAVQDNARAAQDQAAYTERYNALVARYEAAHARLGEIETARTERRAKRANINRFLKILSRHTDMATEFDEDVWYTTMDRVKVFADGRLVVCFRDGGEVELQPQEELKQAVA